MSLKQLFRLLWKNKFRIILPPILVGLGVFMLTRNMTREYESKTIVFTNPTSNRGATDGGVIRMDFYTSNNLFDNLTLLVKSRETIEEASLHLLALHISLPEPDPSVIHNDCWLDLREHIQPSLWQELSVPGDEKETFARIKAHYIREPNSPIEYLLREHRHYAMTKILERLSVARKFSSDMMELSYRTDDAGVCYHTLRLLAKAFMERYSGMKEMENTNSIAYFQSQLDIAQGKLREAEDRLKSFMSENRILNYYEQGKYLDIAKLEHEQDEERSKRLLSGTESNLNEIQEMFQNFDNRQVIIQNISALQDEIVARDMEIQGLQAQNSAGPKITQLEKEIVRLKDQIAADSKELFQNSNSLQGIQRETILEEWLRLKILFEEQKQALDVMQNRKAYLSEKIQEFAPLGAELKKLEREVSVNEDQYLSILHGLNMAYLQKYDLEMSSSQKLIDEPYYPKSPLPSKRMIFIIGGSLATGFFGFSIVVLSFFIDRTIKSVPQAEKVTGLKVSGAWIDELGLSKAVKKDILYNRLRKQVYNNLGKYLPQQGKKIVLFYSLKPAEGKTFLIRKLVEELTLQNRNIVYWGHSRDTAEMPCDTLSYDQQAILYDQQDAYWEERIAQTEKEFILWELPPIEEVPLNYPLINQANVLVMVLDGQRNWKPADERFHESLKEMVKIPHTVWLNRLQSDELEDMNGEIPRDRSFLRAKIKKYLS
ncbi:GumC family protein [Cyclobacterium xiamenense]|uniref:GumC family protein n=1 Tax=Cyclobacterium xiamenense TaxID=1297121 RepID=UPI0012B88937|nr:Wzz/FepE/Etk N-terminal domain-containing protein [Cyclobacterium xiamenense]